MSRITNDGSRTTKKGFTLLEMLLAILLFAVGIVALAQALGAGMYSSTNAGTLPGAGTSFVASDAESVDLALNIAQAKMEEIKNMSFAAIVSVAKAAVSGFGSYSQKVDVTLAGNGTDLKQVDVTVYWATRDGEANIKLSTYAANN